MTAYLIQNGHVIDPSSSTDGVMDVLMRDGVIAEVGTSLNADDATVIDAKGKLVTPGLFDMHVHLREPGREDKETLETGLRAALRGGVTSVLSMPNTTPEADNQTVIEYQLSKARKLDLARLYVTGKITKENGKLAEMWELKQTGAVAVTDDGHDVNDEQLLLSGIEWAKTFDLPLLTHSEMDSLSRGGIMHEGKISQLMGLEGAPVSSEALAIHRTIMLGEEAGAKVHITHVSTAVGVDIIRQAKARGVQVTAEATPQHFGATHEECLGYRTNAKMYPPLREESDRQAVCEGLRDGTIDVIATDHAPHLVSEKLLPFAVAPNGTTGLETLFAAVNTYLVKPGILTWPEAIAKMTLGPASVLNLTPATLQKGAVADVAIFDADTEWAVDSTKFETKGRSNVFEGKTLTGLAATVFVGGILKVQDGNVL